MTFNVINILQFQGGYQSHTKKNEGILKKAIKRTFFTYIFKNIVGGGRTLSTILQLFEFN